MHAELTSTRTSTTRRYRLTGAPMVMVTARLVMVPLEAVVTHADGSWSSLRLSGHAVRDGELTSEPVTHTYYAQWGDIQDVPEWARPLIEETPSA